jgi:hypothetical protein
VPQIARDTVRAEMADAIDRRDNIPFLLDASAFSESMPTFS